MRVDGTVTLIEGAFLTASIGDCEELDSREVSRIIQNLLQSGTEHHVRLPARLLRDDALPTDGRLVVGDDGFERFAPAQEAVLRVATWVELPHGRGGGAFVLPLRDGVVGAAPQAVQLV